MPTRIDLASLQELLDGARHRPGRQAAQRGPRADVEARLAGHAETTA
jgi:hypothetical protein